MWRNSTASCNGVIVKSGYNNVKPRWLIGKIVSEIAAELEVIA